MWLIGWQVKLKFDITKSYIDAHYNSPFVSVWMYHLSSKPILWLWMVYHRRIQIAYHFSWEYHHWWKWKNPIGYVLSKFVNKEWKKSKHCEPWLRTKISRFGCSSWWKENESKGRICRRWTIFNGVNFKIRTSYCLWRSQRGHSSFIKLFYGEYSVSYTHLTLPTICSV